mmetsp:Transcript_29639/g.86310  ORF Transcript_29639/g.86310 Transcript_29639/m.86310 type:complete len:209 (-) Transcript_29639:171-797(-)
MRSIGSGHWFLLIAMFYLKPEDWSPRFDSTFYTVKLTAHEICAGEQPPSSTSDKNRAAISSRAHRRRSIGGSSSYPAVYYCLQIKCGHRTQKVWRRYSQFRSLCHHAASSPPPPSSDPREVEAERKKGSLWSTFPPRQVAGGPCLVIPCITSRDDWKDEEFIEQRQEELGRFLSNLLSRRGYCSHPIVVDFLEMVGLVGDELSLDVVS